MPDKMSNQAPTRTAGQHIVEALVANGVDTIFGIPGAQAYYLFDALYEHRDRIRTIATRHEQGAAYLAYGYAKATGREGAFTVVPGPGVLNASSGLATAYGASAKVLCLTQQVPSAGIGSGRGHLHELPDQLGILERLTKWAARIDHPAEAPGLVEEAFRQMRSGRPRPAALEVPLDVLPAKAPGFGAGRAVGRPTPPADAAALDAAADLIRRAERPMILVGSGAVGARDEVQALAKAIQAPVVAHRSGRGIVSEETPFGFSCGEGFLLWEEADLVIAIGTRMEVVWSRWSMAPRDIPLVRIDIDPREFTRTRAAVAILGDAAEATGALVERTRGRKRGSRESELAAAKADARRRFEKVQPHMGFLRAIRDVLGDDGILVEEICQAGFTARFGYPVTAPRTYIPAGWQDSLGFGFPTGLGVKIACPDRPVVALSGDGGFMFGVQELATARKHGIGLVTIVYNNGAWGNVRRDQATRFPGRDFHAELDNPDFVALAESFGVAGLRAGTPAALAGALREALASGGPALIEVPVDPDQEVSPWEFYFPRR